MVSPSVKYKQILQDDLSNKSYKKTVKAFGKLFIRKATVMAANACKMEIFEGYYCSRMC
jgi:hypothetical protein